MSQQQSIPTAAFSPGEWMRIFACRLAQRRPELSADAVVDVAVNEFPALCTLEPEAAVECCRAARLHD